MAALATMPPMPDELLGFGYLAFQETPRAARTYADSDAARAKAEARRAQDNDERYYRSGKSYLDRKDYDKAVEALTRVVENKGSRADGALYWRAYAQNRLGKREDALASLAELQKNYASSRWLDDAKALQQEIRAQNGQVSPESATDEDLKLLAINSLMNTDPERAAPLLEKLLKSTNSARVKERALFVLAQNHSPKSREVLVAVAKGGSNPDLQLKAIEYLGIYGGRENLQMLVDIYKGSNDVHLKRSILNSFMQSGSRENLLSVAKSESNPELKVQAIQLLGNAGGSADLAQLYAGESSPEVKRAIIQGLFVSGNADKLIELAKSEKDDNLRHTAINQLGVMGRSKTGNTLAGLYAQESNADNKKAIINALFIQNNAPALVEIARKEPDVNMKKTIVQQLSVMHSKEATDYLMEILSK
jgi:tetratricopeptide (TPR) repeat protein